MTINRRTKNKYIFVYSMLAFALIHFSVFWIYVNLDSFALAFIDRATGVWNNFDYFKWIFSDLSGGADSEILGNLANTLKYFFVNTVCQLPLAMFLAYFLYKKILFRGFFMTIFIIPMIISTVVLAAVYQHSVSEGGHIGMLYGFISGAGEGIDLLGNEATATGSILIFCIWTGFGLNLIMFSGAMTRIPESIVESAKLEGIGFWRELFSITAPMIWPTLSILMLLSVTSVFTASGPIILLTGGHAGTSTIDFWMYVHVVMDKEYNLASALGMVFTIASLPIFLTVSWLRNKFSSDVSY